MSRQELSLSAEKIQPFDMESLREKAGEMNRRHRETLPPPFPRTPVGGYLTTGSSPAPSNLPPRAKSKERSAG